MDPARRASAGLILAALGCAGYLVLSVPSGFDLFDAGALAVLLGMPVAAAGVLALPLRGPSTLALGLAVAGVGGACLVASFFDGGFNLYSLGALVLGVALLQAAWFALLWAFEGADDAGRRAGALRLSFLIAGLGALEFLLINLSDGTVPWLLPNVLTSGGFFLAARNFPAGQPSQEAAPERDAEAAA